MAEDSVNQLSEVFFFFKAIIIDNLIWTLNIRMEKSISQTDAANTQLNQKHY